MQPFQHQFEGLRSELSGFKTHYPARHRWLMAHHDRRFYSIPFHRIIPYTREEGECTEIGEQVLRGL